MLVAERVDELQERRFRLTQAGAQDMKALASTAVAAVVVGVAMLAVFNVFLDGPPGLPPLSCGTPLSPREGFEALCDPALASRRSNGVFAVAAGSALGVVAYLGRRK